MFHSLEHTQKATVTSYYGLLTLCPLFEGLLQEPISSSFHIFLGATLIFNFFKVSHLLGATSIFNFLQLQWNIKFPKRPNSNLDQDQRQNLQQEQDRRRGQVALEDNLSVEMGNDDSHFPPLSNTTKGETFWTHN